MRGLKNRGLMEVSEDPGTGDFVLVISKRHTREVVTELVKNQPSQEDVVCKVLQGYGLWGG